jgi:hypothetical protein
VVLDELPEGWSVNHAELESDERLGWRRPQTLYLGEGATPEAGPALVVGDFSQDDGAVSCGGGRATGLRWNSPASADLELHRRGDVVVSGEMDTDQPGYVMGRELTDAQALAAARAARFAPPDAAMIGADGLPPNFRRIATAPVAPFSAFGEVIHLRPVDGRRLVRISAYEGDDATELLTRFWRVALPRDPCEEGATARQRLGDTEILVTGNVDQALVDRIASGLRAADHAGFERFRARIDDQPASALVPCPNPGGSVYVEGVVDDTRWVLAMPSHPDALGASCHAFVVDREWGGAGIGGGSPDGLLLGPGSHDIQVLGGVTDHGPDGAKHLSGGTVPSTAERVVITTGGKSIDAVLVDGGDDPRRRYFGGLILSGPEPFSLDPTTIVAYDAAGREVARYNQP